MVGTFAFIEPSAISNKRLMIIIVFELLLYLLKLLRYVQLINNLNFTVIAKNQKLSKTNMRTEQLTYPNYSNS